MNQSLYEKARPITEAEDEKAILQAAADVLKKAGIKAKGKMTVTRSYHGGAEVHLGLGAVGRGNIFLEITLDLEKSTPTGNVRLRSRQGGQSSDIASDGEIKQLAKLLSKIT